MRTVTTSTVFGLQHKVTGELVNIYSEENDGHGNANRYTLSTLNDFSIFEVDTAEKAALVLAINTPWYNSSPESPSRGSVDVSELEVVEIVRTMEVKPVAITGPVTFDNPVISYGKFRSIAERYLGYKIPEDATEPLFQMSVVYLPEGETLDSLREKCRGRAVIIGKGNQYPELGLGVFELPEEYAGLLKDKPGVGLIYTHFRR